MSQFHTQPERKKTGIRSAEKINRTGKKEVGKEEKKDKEES